jgi:hypothetical protein
MFASRLETVGAPSLRFLQGREYRTPAASAFLKRVRFTAHDNETKSRSNPRLTEPVRLR